jgi:hypothetical protein
MNEFTGISVVTLQEHLVEAQDALHKVATQKAIVTIVTADGKRLNFSPVELPQLRRYILRLQMAIAIANGQTVSAPFGVATWTR